MNEALIVFIIWLICIVVSAGVVIHMQTHKRRPLDYAGWTLGISIFDVFITILSVTTIICYLQK